MVGTDADIFGAPCRRQERTELRAGDYERGNREYDRNLAGGMKWVRRRHDRIWKKSIP